MLITLESPGDVFSLQVFEPSDFVYRYQLSIRDTNDISAESKVVGRCALFYIDVQAAMNAEESLFDVFDAAHHNTMVAFEHLFEYSGELLLKVEDVIGFTCNSNVLLLDHLEIIPSYRGKKLGLAVMQRIMQRYGGGVSLVIIKPFPLQFEPKPENPSDWYLQVYSNGHLAKLDEGEAVEKLKRYYSEIGFEPVPETPFMVPNLDNVQPGISFED